MTVQDVHEELRAQLHEAAAAHEPDRARILARVERGMAGAARPAHRTVRPRAAGWARVAGATAAVAGVLAVGSYAVASAVREEAPPQRTVAVSPTPTPTPPPAPTPSSAPSREAAGRTPVPPAVPAPGTAPESAGPSASPERRPSSPGGVADGPLWSDGSVDPHSHEFWAQSNITLKTREPLTALTVRLEIRQTGGVSSTGAWRSLPEDDFTLTVGERDGFLVYTWVLKPGRTVPAGEWMFAGQYDHERGGRDAKGDRYTATATTAAGARGLAVEGDFAARGAAATADADAS